jgi:hypothetical protein
MPDLPDGIDDLPRDGERHRAIRQQLTALIDDLHS